MYSLIYSKQEGEMCKLKKKKNKNIKSRNEFKV